MVVQTNQLKNALDEINSQRNGSGLVSINFGENVLFVCSREIEIALKGYSELPDEIERRR